jgi:hypothetical protein
MRLIRRGTDGLRRRPGTRWVVLAALVVGVVVAAAPTGVPAAPSNPYPGISFTLEGCRNTGTITLPNGSGQFICPDAAYTTGNLGKGWNELDLVPFRTTLGAGNSAPASLTYTIVMALDASDAGHPGYDVISAPVLNTSLSDAGCAAATASAQQTLTPGVGGTDSSIYRTWTVTQSQNTTCVYDWYGRLALGSHLYPGSSLHADLLNSDFGTANVGAKDVSIPVNEITPQSLSKDMTATQNSDHTWNVAKQPMPADVSFGNTCDAANPTSKPVSIAVTWTKGPATPSGDITVTTHVYATNPSARTITTNVTDVIYSGTTALNSSSSSTDVPANKTELVLTHTTTVSEGTTDLNDIATGTYVDQVTGVPIPGSTTATASATVQQSGVDLNSSAVINDTESISGPGLSYSTDSFSGASGAFDGGYVAGTKTTGSVSWTSASQSGSGGVTFGKTVYVDPKVSTSGSLTDTAKLTGSDGFTTSANASVSLSAHPLVSLTINKTISAVAGIAQTFYFDVSGPTPSTGNPLTIAAGHLSNSITLTGLEPGSYTVHEETPPSPWVAPGDRSVNLSLPTCTGSVSFANTFAPATAEVQKVTDPAGNEAGWTFTMSGSDGTSESVTTTGTGYMPFATQLVDGVTYTITETSQSNWDLTNVTGGTASSGGSPVTTTAGSCSFTPHYFTNPNDPGNVFQCTFKNVERGSVVVKKVTDPTGSPDTFSFNSNFAGSFTLMDGGSNPTNNLVPGSGYSVSETPLAGYTLASATCDHGTTSAVQVLPGQTTTCTFTNKIRGHVRVVKTINGAPLTASSPSFTFELRMGDQHTTSTPAIETLTTNATNLGTLDFKTDLVPGQLYAICELLMASYNPTISGYGPYNPGDNANYWCWNFTLTFADAASNPSLVFTVDNSHPQSKGLTIGFWKNWSSCKKSRGNQTDVLGQYLGGITLGTVTFGNSQSDECNAVQTLSKNTFSGKNQASDPLFNVAAQLLAADLNVNAQAGVCAAVISAIQNAQALLVKYGWNGNTYSPKLTSADAALANSLAATLDKYNNNQLC